MRRPNLFLLCAFCLALPASAQLPEEQMRTAAAGMEADLGLTATMEAVRSGKVPAAELAMLYLVLEHTQEINSHRLGGATGNKVMLHEDGHREAVFDAEGKLVRDGTNDPSYNYYHPEEQPLRHFAFDTTPWLLWGNTRQDKSTLAERVDGFLLDFVDGLRAAWGERERLAALSRRRWADDGQVQALAILLRVREAGDASAFPLFGGAEDISPEGLEAARDRLREGFLAVFGG